MVSDDNTTLEADLAETHRLLNGTKSNVVRDHLHELLNALLQKKQNLLSAGSNPNLGSAGRGVTLPSAADFARNMSMAGSHQNGGIAPPQVQQRDRIQQDLGEQSSEADSKSTSTNGTPIEPINTSGVLLSAFDPVWQPGQRSSSAAGTIDGFMPTFELAAAGLSSHSTAPSAAEPKLDAFGTAVSQYMREFPDVFRQAQQQVKSTGSGNGMVPLQLQHAPAGASAIQQQRSRQNPQRMQRHQHQHQDGAFLAMSGGFQTAGSAMGGQPPPPPPHAAKPLLSQTLPGTYGAGNPTFGSAAGSCGRLNLPGGGGGGGFGGSFGSAGPGSYGAGRAMPGPFSSLPFAGNANLADPFGGGVHPALQYGIDLRGGELDAMGLPLFRPLTTYSWEQSDGLVKIYVPLRGVQTDLLRATFTPTSVEVRVVALQGKNYVYSVKTLYLPINSDGCHVAASKTKKNVLITLQKVRSETPDEKHWQDLTAM